MNPLLHSSATIKRLLLVFFILGFLIDLSFEADDDDDDDDNNDDHGDGPVRNWKNYGKCINWVGDYFFELQNYEAVKSGSEFERYFQIFGTKANTPWILINETDGNYFQKFYGQRFKAPTALGIITRIQIACDYENRIFEEYMPFTAKVMDLTCLRMVGSLFCEGIRYADIKRETMVHGRRMLVQKCWKNPESVFDNWGYRQRQKLAINNKIGSKAG